MIDNKSTVYDKECQIEVLIDIRDLLQKLSTNT